MPRGLQQLVQPFRRRPAVALSIVACLAASFLMLLTAISAGRRFYFWWPLATTVMALGLTIWLLSSPVPKIAHLGGWRISTACIVIVVVFLSTGGFAYTYGASGGLVPEMVADSATLSFAPGINHTISLSLYNPGTVTVRVAPWFYLIMRSPDGSDTPVNYTCGVATVGPPADEDAMEIPPGGRILLWEFRLWSVGGRVETDCMKWTTTAGSAYYLHAWIRCVPGVMTLPHWVGNLDSNKVALVA